jgi:hypothetical protein
MISSLVGKQTRDHQLATVCDLEATAASTVEEAALACQKPDEFIAPGQASDEHGIRERRSTPRLFRCRFRVLLDSGASRSVSAAKTFGSARHRSTTFDAISAAP